MKMSRHVTAGQPARVVLELSDREHAMFRELMESHVDEQNVIDAWVDNMEMFVADNNGHLPDNFGTLVHGLAESLDLLRAMTQKM